MTDKGTRDRVASNYPMLKLSMLTGKYLLTTAVHYLISTNQLLTPQTLTVSRHC